MARKITELPNSLTEELEEDSASKSVSTWEDYKFVTKEELADLNLSHLVGTHLLRGYMHGYFMDARLHQRVKAVAQPEKYDEWKKEQVRKRIEAKRGQRISMRSTLPKVNKELALRQQLLTTKEGKSESTNDDRFKDLFSDPDFQIDEASEEFKLSNPSGITSKEIELRKQHGLISSSDRNVFIDSGESSFFSSLGV